MWLTRVALTPALLVRLAGSLPDPEQDQGEVQRGLNPLITAGL